MNYSERMVIVGGQHYRKFLLAKAMKSFSLRFFHRPVQRHSIFRHETNPFVLNLHPVDRAKASLT
jgi:hypothetical protein